MPTFKLYSYWRSSSSWRVRAALALKGVDYDYEAIHLVADGGQQHAAGYANLNPMEQVPLLEVTFEGGEVARVGQSVAIMELLEELVPMPSILPQDPIERARCRQLAEIVNAGIQPMQNLAVIQHLRDELGADHVAWCQRYIARGLEAFERTLAAHTGSYCLPGPMPSMADVCLVPQLYNARRFKLDLSAHPRLLSIEAACLAHPAFGASHPDRQPDAQATS
jgi:maleylpyruvate isomerase